MHLVSGRNEVWRDLLGSVTPWDWCSASTRKTMVKRARREEGEGGRCMRRGGRGGRTDAWEKRRMEGRVWNVEGWRR